MARKRNVKEKSGSEGKSLESRLSRRNLFGILGTGFITALAMNETVQKGLTKLIKSVNDGRRVYMDSLRAFVERKRILCDLFGGPHRFLLVPGADHLSGIPPNLVSKGQKAYTHDEIATNAFAALFPEEAITETNSYFEEEVLKSDCLVCSGSPVSNLFARKFLPHLEIDTQNNIVSPILKPEFIPYHFLIGSKKKKMWVRSSMLGGKFTEKSWNGIIKNTPSGSELWYPSGYVDKDDRLAKDFLIVSRLPRDYYGGEVALISGGHGAGTQAFELLFDEQAISLDELRDLHSKITNNRYFQIVFEVSDINHDLPMTTAKKLSLSKECPPRVIDFHTDIFMAGGVLNGSTKKT